MVLLPPLRGSPPSTGSHERLGTFFCLSFEAMRLHPLPYYHSYRPTIVTKTVTNFRTRGDFRRKGNLLNTMLRQSLFQQAVPIMGTRGTSYTISCPAWGVFFRLPKFGPK